MCAYKLCKAEFAYFGAQRRVEAFIHEVALRKTLLVAHRQVICEDIYRYPPSLLLLHTGLYLYLGECVHIEDHVLKWGEGGGCIHVFIYLAR